MSFQHSFQIIKTHNNFQFCKHIGICLFVLLFAFLTTSYSQESKFVSLIGDTHIDGALACSPDGNNIYLSGLYTLAAFKRATDGTLTVLKVYNNNHAGVKDIHYMRNMVISPNGQHLYAVDLWNPSLKLFTRDSTTGEITLAGQVHQVGRSDKLLFAPDGRHLYSFHSGGSTGGEIIILERNAQTGGGIGSAGDKGWRSRTWLP